MRVIRPGNIESKNWLVFEDYALSIDGRYIEEKGGPAPGQEFALHESNLVRIMLGQYCDLNDPDDALSYVRLWGFPVRAVNGSVSVDELLESAASMRFLALVIDCLDNPVSVKNKLTVRGDVLDQLFKQWSKSTGEEIYGKFLAKLPILMSSTIQKLKSGSG
ncbi:MAG: hypothetical protein K8F91_03305, partial [Candidatus Obscuribacterales bacterium]|nr:hypothetical protein [Candidatus Obscuribacterales bacterium]